MSLFRNARLFFLLPPPFLQEYVRGLCDPELQKEERYPGDMHCIFAGARGLFLDRLVRDTSAEVVVPEPGRLRLLGRAEPVVMAQSRIQQFVALFQVWCEIVWKQFCLKYCFGFLSHIYFDYYYVRNYKAIIYQ